MFEDVFAKWDVHGSGSLSAAELWHMIKGHRLAADPFGVCSPTGTCFDVVLSGHSGERPFLSLAQPGCWYRRTGGSRRRIFGRRMM
jgi:hypothetical protein